MPMKVKRNWSSQELVDLGGDTAKHTPVAMPAVRQPGLTENSLQILSMAMPPGRKTNADDSTITLRTGLGGWADEPALCADLRKNNIGGEADVSAYGRRWKWTR